VQALQVLISGISQGCIYGLIALGFVLIYKATETVNFAQGELMMLGAFLGLTATTGLGLSYWAAIPIALAGMALVGLLIERATLRPILGQPAFSVVMVTIGLGYVARGAVTMVPFWGTETHTLPAPFRGEIIRAGELVIGMEHVVIIAATVLLCGVLFLFFRYSRVGIAMQAASQNQLAAYYMGIPVRRLNGFIWAISAAVAALAGVLLAPITGVHPAMGAEILTAAFVVVVIGGLGSFWGVVWAALIVGVVRGLTVYFYPAAAEASMYLLMVLVLLVRPRGLFGERIQRFE
jgi:branched-chain amino acid transport system permease protein